MTDRPAGWRAWVSMPRFIAAMSALYALAMFRGVECHSGYHGSVYQVLHPGSFPNDPFMSPDRPTMLSLYYLLVKVVGGLWLDDRFLLALYTGLTALALTACDRTVQLFGARRLSERAAMLALMLLGHTVLANHAFLMDNNDFNPTALACPFLLWLLYHSLAGHGPRIVLPLILFIAAISIKNVWLPAIIALAVLWKERLGTRGKLVAAAAAVALVALAAAGYYRFLRPSDETAVKLFDYLHWQVDDAEADPFMNPAGANAVFLSLCLAGFLLRGLPPRVAARVRIVAGIGIAAWFAGGWYLNGAPNALKIPYLVPFDVTRALWWPQYVLWAALGVALLTWLQRTSSSRGLCAAWAGLMGLYFLHDSLHLKLVAVVGLATLGMLWLAWRARTSGRWRLAAIDPPMRVRIVAVAMCLGTLSLYGVGTVHRRWAALAFLMRHGVMGDNAGAMWVGVDEYLRERTAPSATVFALAARSAVGRELGLDYQGSLRSRTGRSMPIGSPATIYFDYERLQWLKAQHGHLQALLAAWGRQDAPGVSAGLVALGSPGYLVVPAVNAEWLRTVRGFPYAVETVIGDYLIMRQVPLTGGHESAEWIAWSRS